MIVPFCVSLKFAPVVALAVIAIIRSNNAQAIPLVAGAVKLSIVVRDTESGRVGSLVIPLGQASREGTRN